MYDYIEIFCDLIDCGNDMSDVIWSEFQEAAATAIYERADLENVEIGELQ